MKTRDFLPSHAVLLLLLAVLCPLLLTQCKTTGGTYQQIEYDSATLNTPSGHGLEKKDYPFDDQGNYRKDWVKNKSRGKVGTASKRAENVSTVSPATNAGASSTASAPTSYPGYAGPATSTAAPPPPPAPVPAPASPRYHKVSSGDTLFSLARKYGTSVNELKQVNGLTGDGIRTGQQLRLP